MFVGFSLQFGEVDIDGSLVASHSSSNEDIVMVNNGCLCCTVRGDLVKMLLELVKKRRDKFDHIVIETTGKSTFRLRNQRTKPCTDVAKN